MRISHCLLLFSVTLLFMNACMDSIPGPEGISAPPQSSLVITGIQPTQGSPGTAVSITGSGFGNTPAAVTVTFSDAEAAIEELESGLMIVIVPESATSGPVTVRSGSAERVGPTFTVLENGEEG